MMNLYYVVEKELKNIDGFEETTGWKTITVYDIDTQTISLIVVTELTMGNSANSEERIKEELELLDYKDYKLIKL